MQNLLSWTLEAIRGENSDFSWMEEYRFDWTPLVNIFLEHILSGQSVLVLTDAPRQWFGDYIQSKINDLSKNRPFLPFYQLAKLFSSLDEIQNNQEWQLLEDMLDISFPNGYIIWYIGKDNSPYTKLVFKKDNSFLWIVDSQIQNGFHLNGSDPLFDIKLLQLFRLLDKTISEALYGNIEIES